MYYIVLHLQVSAAMKCVVYFFFFLLLLGNMIIYWLYTASNKSWRIRGRKGEREEILEAGERDDGKKVLKP